ncbi:MAG: hypothetical protein ABI873_04155 [Marmoricola sp.]
MLVELADSRDISFAVMHRNPYLHVAVADTSDGSNYDLFVTQSDVIELHPGFRASLGSLSRIAQGLGDRFEASYLREQRVPEPVALADLAND